jgi:uroporphyrinogen III methyltransferase/synthase
MMAAMSAPLDGLRILLTRPSAEQTDRWATALSAAGAVVVPYPTIQLLPPPSWEPLDRALRRLDQFEWVVFTSQPAVLFTASRLPGGRFAPGLTRPRVAAVGGETARALERTGAQVALTPDDQRQEGLIAALAELPAGTSLLFPHAFAGREALIESLRRQGCAVEVVAAYQTAPRAPLPPPPPFDVATFASPSALRVFVERHGAAVLASRIVAVIGPTTAVEAAAHGITPVVAARPSVDALVAAIADARLGKGDN